MIIFKKAEHLYVHTELQLFIFSLCVLKETSFSMSYIVSKKVRLSLQQREKNWQITTAMSADSSTDFRGSYNN